MLRTWGRRVAIAIGLAAVGVGVPALLLHGYSYTMANDYFAINYIDVEGLDLLDEEELLRASEAIAGEHLFNIRPERLEAVIATLPFVADVQVQRRFPDRLYIQITEFEPAAILVDQGLWLVDANGRVFLSLEDGASHAHLWDLPMITGLTRADLEQGPGALELEEALLVHNLYEELGLMDQQEISEIHVDKTLGISLVLGSTGTEVRLGRGRWRERLERLAVVQASLIRRGVDAAYILVDQERSLGRIAVGLRTGPGIGEVMESQF